MNRGINKVLLLGNLGKDPDIFNVSNYGDRVARLVLATDDFWINKEGEKISKTEWHNLILYGKLVDIVDRFLRKGSRIYVEGSLKRHSWEKDGIKKYRTEIVVKELQILDKLDDTYLKNESDIYGGKQGDSYEEYDNNIDNIDNNKRSW